MTTNDVPVSDSLGTTAKTVRFPTMLAEWLELRANDQDRSFSQEVILACRGHQRLVDEPGRQELETPSPHNAPAFRLVPHLHQGDEPITFDVEVEGSIVPHLVVTKIDDADWVEFEKSLGHSGEGYNMSLDNRFGIQAHSYEELWRWGWFIAHCMAVAQGRVGHTSPYSREPVPPMPQVVEEGWDAMERGGSCGFTYELTMTFAMPAVDRGDEWARGARDHLLGELSGVGGRDVQTRIVRLASMSAEPATTT